MADITNTHMALLNKFPVIPEHLLLVTRAWMLLVPRSRERFESVSINALGYAGSLFVKNDAELARIRDKGPMGVLSAVARG